MNYHSRNEERKADIARHAGIVERAMKDHGFAAERRDDVVFVWLSNRAVTKHEIWRVIEEEEMPIRYDDIQSIYGKVVICI